MKIEIKRSFSSEVLFIHECEGNSVAITLAAAINAKTDLRGADLRRADLRSTDLRGANLYGANLRAADLGDADLYGADLRRADLRRANLYGTNLRAANLGDTNLGDTNLGDANLRGANLGDAGKLTGDRPFFQVGPIGSRQDVLAAFLTGKGVLLRAGCFFGTVEEFRDKLQKEYGDNVHAVEYRAALVLVEAHYNAWPATVES